MPLQIRRGTNSQRLAMTEPLASGELLYTTDTGSLYIGNGTSLGGVPLSNLTPGDIKDLSASIFQAGVHSGITFNYNNTTKSIDAIVEPDLSNYAGTIRADAFQGNLIAENSTLIFNSIDGSINLDGTVQGDIIPDDNATYDIGSSTFRFRDIYLSGSSIHLGNALITASGTAVNLPAGSTVNGTLIGSGGGVGDGVIAGSNYNINIVGDDSTLIVNSSSKTLNAVSATIGTLNGTTNADILNGNQFNGTHNGPSFGTHYGVNEGNVIGNVTGNLTGDVRGNVLAEDSTVLVDYTNGTTGGTHAGNVIGTVLGDTYGTHYGNVTGNLTGNITAVSGSIGSFSSTSGSLGKLNYSSAGVITNDDYEIEGGVAFHIDRNINYLGSVIQGPDPDPYTTAVLSVSVGTFVDQVTPLGIVLPNAPLFFTSVNGHNDVGFVASAAQGFIVDGTPTVGADSLPTKYILQLADGVNPIGSSNAILMFDNTGKLSVPVMQVGGYPTVSLPTPTAGMIVLDTTTNEFKGYNGTAWVVLG